MCYIAPRPRKGLLDKAALDIIHAKPLNRELDYVIRSAGRLHSAADLDRQVLQSNLLRVFQNKRSLKYVSKLADVARPWIGLEDTDRV
jgi:hypothetical protein